jgi:hypothetical protein
MLQTGELTNDRSKFFIKTFSQAWSHQKRHLTKETSDGDGKEPGNHHLRIAQLSRSPRASLSCEVTLVTIFQAKESPPVSSPDPRWYRTFSFPLGEDDRVTIISLISDHSPPTPTVLGSSNAQEFEVFDLTFGVDGSNRWVTFHDFKGEVSASLSVKDASSGVDFEVSESEATLDGVEFPAEIPFVRKARNPRSSSRFRTRHSQDFAGFRYR